MPSTEKIKKKINSEKIIKEKKDTILKPRSIARFFGIDKNEVDGLQFQKQVRNEWQ
jgi:hypothetical protein